ncbi:hypothetical protein B0H34DRAFT_684974 [Crassisporium funariophilum]|nr:hypothetical protein B0H34DRAFT_684974 [Crassisporium funariophilum]
MTLGRSSKGLPQEILDLIMDEAGDAALCSCILVSRAFFHRARLYIFRTITLCKTLSDDDEEEVFAYFAKRLSGLRSILQPRSNSLLPPVAPLVKKFTIDFRSPISIDLRSTATRFQETFDNGDLAAILRTLHCTEFGPYFLSIWMSPFCTLDMASISQEFRASFCSLVRSQHLTHLQLFNISNVPLDIFAGAHLKSLRLSQTRVATVYSTDPTLGHGYPLLDHLDTDHNFPLNCFIEDTGLQDLFSFSRLKRLRTNIGNAGEFEKSRKIILSAASSLEQLELRVYSLLFRPLDIGFLSRLQTLRFLDCSYNAVQRVLQNFCLMLHSPMPAQTLNRLEIRIFFGRIDPASDFIRFGLGPEWHLLDATLSDPRFASVCLIKISLDFEVLWNGLGSFDEDSFASSTRRCLRAVLPTLSTSTSLALDLEFTTVLVELFLDNS